MQVERQNSAAITRQDQWPKDIDAKFELYEDEAALAEHLRVVRGLSTSDDFDSTYLFNALRICQPNKIDNLE